MKLQKEIQQQTIKDNEAGKYKDISEIPLYRTPDGQVTNIPENMMRWYIFMSWLNDLNIRWNKLN